MAKQLSGAAATRASLIAAGLKLFGEHGYDAVSTRQIADHAASNIGSIAYHFGGKPGLRVACIDYVIGAIMEAMAVPLAQPLPAALPSQEALSMLEQMFVTLVHISTQRPDAEEISTFITREMVMPGGMLDHLYVGMVHPLHERVEQLFLLATGLTETSEHVRLTIFSLMGQTMFFRLCKPALMRRMNWSHLGERETEAMAATVTTNLRAVVRQFREDVASRRDLSAPIPLFG